MFNGEWSIWVCDKLVNVDCSYKPSCLGELDEFLTLVHTVKEITKT